MYCNRAASLTHLGRQSEAEADYNKAQDLDPEYPDTYAGLGNLAFVRKDYPAAIAHYTVAINHQPEASFYFGRALAYFAHEDFIQHLINYYYAIALADSTAVAQAREVLDAFAAEHPGFPGLGTVHT